MIFSLSFGLLGTREKHEMFETVGLACLSIVSML